MSRPSHGAACTDQGSHTTRDRSVRPRSASSATTWAMNERAAGRQAGSQVARQALMNCWSGWWVNITACAGGWLRESRRVRPDVQPPDPPLHLPWQSPQPAGSRQGWRAAAHPPAAAGAQNKRPRHADSLVPGIGSFGCCSLMGAGRADDTAAVWFCTAHSRHSSITGTLVAVRCQCCCLAAPSPSWPLWPRRGPAGPV